MRQDRIRNSARKRFVTVAGLALLGALAAAPRAGATSIISTETQLASFSMQVLTGQITLYGNDVRVTAELDDEATHTHLYELVEGISGDATVSLDGSNASAHGDNSNSLNGYASSFVTNPSRTFAGGLIDTIWPFAVTGTTGPVSLQLSLTYSYAQVIMTDSYTNAFSQAEAFIAVCQPLANSPNFSPI